MIDWTRVTVGETEIVHQDYRMKILGIHRASNDDYVWCLRNGGFYETYRKSHLLDWTIDDPWEEITEECEWIKYDLTKDSWGIVHNNGIVTRPVIHDDPNFKSDGRRVWKRKEG